MLKTPQLFSHHFQDEVQTHSTVVNCHGLGTAYLSSLISLSFPRPCAPSTLNLLHFWNGQHSLPTWIFAHRFLHSLSPLSEMSPLSEISRLFLLLLSSSDKLCAPFNTYMLLSGSSLDLTCPCHPLYSLPLLAEFGRLSPADHCNSTYYT